MPDTGRRSNSVVVALMRRAGLVILGKCTTTEFAEPGAGGRPQPARSDPHARRVVERLGCGGRRFHGAACDRLADRRLDHPAGRLSAASSAIKASLTGIDRGNIRQLRPTLDTIGLLARSIADLAALHGVLNGGAGPLAKTDVRSLRIGVCHTNNWQHAQPETVDAMVDAEKRLAAAGATLRQAELPAVFDGIEETFGVISSVEASRALAQEAREHHDKLNFWIKDALAAAARHTPARFDQAQRHAIECQAALGKLFETCDVLLTPSTSGEAPADLVSVSSSAFNRTWTLMHVPCVTIPAYRGPNGMPVGVQIVGPDRQRRAHHERGASHRRVADVTHVRSL